MTNSGAPVVIFPHVSKTAGTTLRRILEGQYGRDAVFKVDGYRLRESVDRLRQLPADEARAIRAAMGHMPFGLHAVLPGPCTYVTLVRDPVERLISHYYYSKQVPRAPHHTMVTSERLSLKDYVESSSRAYLMNNGQTRILGCDISAWHRPTSPDMLDAAKRNIEEHFAVVGVTERFDESLLLMKAALGWNWPLYVRQRVTENRPQKEDIPADVVEAIAERNQLDAELHRYANERLGDALSKKDPSFWSDLSRFRARNAAAARSA
jgi:hypothetical protein